MRKSYDKTFKVKVALDAISGIMKSLFNGDSPFDTPKPVKLMRRLLELFCIENDYVMDFFCGSGSFAHGAYEVNSEKKIDLRWINDHLPETTLRKTYYTIADTIKERRTEDDILYELLQKIGLDLAVPIEKKTIAGKNGEFDRSGGPAGLPGYADTPGRCGAFGPGNRGVAQEAGTGGRNFVRISGFRFRRRRYQNEPGGHFGTVRPSKHEKPVMSHKIHIIWDNRGRIWNP